MPRKGLPPLLSPLADRPAEPLHYLGVSYGLTTSLLRFWLRGGYRPLYARQTPNLITGEHTCIMVRPLARSELRTDWLDSLHADFCRRLLTLLGYRFRELPPPLALSLLSPKTKFDADAKPKLTLAEVERHLTAYDLRRVHAYARGTVDYHVIVDVLPTMATLYFSGQLPVTLSPVQAAVLCGLGLQRLLVDELEQVLSMPANQLLAMLGQLVRKLSKHLARIEEEAAASALGVRAKERRARAASKLHRAVGDVAGELEAELEQGAQQANAKLQAQQASLIQALGVGQYTVDGDDAEWDSALNSARSLNTISVKKVKRKSSAAATAADNDSLSSGSAAGKHAKKGKKGASSSFKNKSGQSGGAARRHSTGGSGKQAVKQAVKRSRK